MADQMLAQGGDQVPKLTIEQSLSRYVANADLSDVCFLVGNQREKVYAHRVFLAIESEVFKAMLYGELKESNYEIEVPDLTPTGFRNMMRYFYTKKIEEIDLSEIYETYMAANKYIASAFIRDLTDHIKRRLSVSTVCLVYDQLLKLNINDLPISEVRMLIASRFSEACKSDSFKQIDENTLISILKFNGLNVTELELLKACMIWTDSEVLRQNSVLEADETSKRSKFEAIKHLIRFGDIKAEAFGSIAKLPHYLTFDEMGSLFFHMFQPSSPIQIEYQSPRGPLTVQVAKAIKTADTSQPSSVRELKWSIEVNKAVSVSSIQTFGVTRASICQFKVCRDEKELPSNCKIVSLQTNYPKAYKIDLNLLLEPKTKYELKFSFLFDQGYNYNYGQFMLATSSAMNLKSELKSEVVFELKSALGYHCIESIQFTGPFE